MFVTHQPCAACAKTMKSYGIGYKYRDMSPRNPSIPTETKEIPTELWTKLHTLGIIDTLGTRDTHIGKSNYSTQLIQPWTIWLAYPELTSWDHDIIKRILRTKEGDDRSLDYEKIKHICDERLRQLSL